MEELISVIVPVYNVEKYLAQCIKSILCQDYINFELILVNDGSTDKSGMLCDQFAEIDKRIKVIHKKNGGPADARNVGIDNALGSYITYVDSDDFVIPQYISRLYDLISKYKADISICKDFRYSEGEVNYKTNGKKEIILFEKKDEAIKNLCYQKQISNGPCAKMYKKKLFKNIRYPVGMWYEDLDVIYKLLKITDRVVWCSDQIYYYRNTPHSIMNSKFNKHKMDRIIISKYILNSIEKEVPNAINAGICRMFVSCVQVLREIPDEFDFESVEWNIVSKYINKYKYNVLKDKEAKKINRIIAFSCFFNLKSVKKLGGLYKKLYER